MLHRSASATYCSVCNPGKSAALHHKTLLSDSCNGGDRARAYSKLFFTNSLTVILYPLQFPNQFNFLAFRKLTRICTKYTYWNIQTKFIVVLFPVIRNFLFFITKLHRNRIKNRKNFCNVLRTVKAAVIWIKAVIVITA